MNNIFLNFIALLALVLWFLLQGHDYTQFDPWDVETEIFQVN